MNRDLDYFTEFLADPSAVSLGEFYRMVKEWANYVMAHKDDFDYLADDEWKEIRERLLAELSIREAKKEAVEAEWAEMCEIFENVENLHDWELVKLLNRQLEFMKAYQGFYNFTDEAIVHLETKIPEFVEKIKIAEKAEAEARKSKMKLDQSIADLDDELVRHYERTGKIVSLPSYPNKKKKPKGN